MLKKKTNIALFSFFLVLTLIPLMSAVTLNEDITIRSNGLNTKITFSNPISDNDATADEVQINANSIYFINLNFEYNDNSYICATLNITESNLVLDTSDMTDYCSCLDCVSPGGGGGTTGSTTVTTGEPVEPVTTVSITITENLTSADLFNFEYFTGNWTKGETNKIEIYVYDINKVLIDPEDVEIILDQETITQEVKRINTGKYIGRFKLDSSIDEVKMKIKVTKGNEVVEESLSITIQEKENIDKFLDFIQNPYVIVIIILVFSLFTFLILRAFM